MTRVAVISNVNVSPIARMLSRDDSLEIWEPDGYGDILGTLMNPSSGFADFDSALTFILVDANQLLLGADGLDAALGEVDSFFSILKSVQTNSQLFVSDLSFRHDPFADDLRSISARTVSAHWDACIKACSEEGTGVSFFEYSRLVETMGKEGFYSERMWYLGRIPHTFKAQRAIADAIADTVSMAMAPRKKVLFTDLDNTLWGGVVGELGAQGIELSDEHMGLVYKDIQRELLRIKNAGVVLGIVSKNNPDDALEAIRENDQMILREEDFSIMYLNWERKDANISNAAKVLNLGIDSFVFLDDNPTERELVSTMLPEVTVLPFPDDVVAVPAMLRDAYDRYFRPIVLTKEAQEKTEQYAAMAKSAALQESSASFEEYLRALELRVNAVNPEEHIDRLAEMIAKTNQFNLTTKRYSRADLVRMLAEPESFRIYAYEVVDRFANNGLTVLAIVKLGTEPVIDEFLMSCRVMGRRIEDYVIDRIERDMIELGYDELRAEYSPTKKNVPVKTLYSDLGYGVLEQNGSTTVYSIELPARPERAFEIVGGSDE